MELKEFYLLLRIVFLLIRMIKYKKVAQYNSEKSLESNKHKKCMKNQEAPEKM